MKLYHYQYYQTAIPSNLKITICALKIFFIDLLVFTDKSHKYAIKIVKAIHICKKTVNLQLLWS
jgi:hypothetical protein